MTGVTSAALVTVLAFELFTLEQCLHNVSCGIGSTKLTSGRLFDLSDNEGDCEAGGEVSKVRSRASRRETLACSSAVLSLTAACLPRGLRGLCTIVYGRLAVEQGPQGLFLSHLTFRL